MEVLWIRRTFWERFPGILPRKRVSEPFRRSVYLRHFDGISRSRLGQEKGSAAPRWSLVRWTSWCREQAERSRAVCPRVLGIDEHFFIGRNGYATTFCNLSRHTVFDVVLGRSEATLESYLNRLPGKERVRVVCMDLSSA